MAQEVREMLTSSSWDCVAVPLPPSIEVAVESAIEALPTIHLVILEESDGHDPPAVSFIPIDPCQPVIMAIRNAMGEGVARAYIDREVTVFEPAACPAPDSYALKQVSIGAFAAAMVTVAPTPQPDSQRKHRIDWMAFRLHELELDYERIVCLCHVHDWPWVRDAYREGLPYRPPDAGPRSVQTAVVTPETLYFVLAELPYLTALFERRRAKVQTDRHLSIDGIKELLLATREHWLSTTQSTGLGATNWVTPQVLQLFLQYVRNLALLDQRLTPDLYSLSVAAKQIAGDQFAITLIETATRYEPRDLSEPSWRQSVEAGIDQLTLEDGRTVAAKNRLAGPPIVWRSLSLQPEPKPLTHRRWGLQWDPFRQCSWPPEDQKIESFTSHVRDQARALLGADLARVEKFTTSIKDGIDLRESLRNWPRKQRPARHPADTAARLQARMDVYVKDIPRHAAMSMSWYFSSTLRRTRRAIRGGRPGMPNTSKSRPCHSMRRTSSNIWLAPVSANRNTVELSFYSRLVRSPIYGQIEPSTLRRPWRSGCWPALHVIRKNHTSCSYPRIPLAPDGDRSRADTGNA